MPYPSPYPPPLTAGGEHSREILNSGLKSEATIVQPLRGFGIRSSVLAGWFYL